MTTLEKILKEFENKFIVRNYEADAHTEDVHITDRPEDIKSFITKVYEQARQEAIEKTESELPNILHEFNREMKYSQNTIRRMQPLERMALKRKYTEKFISSLKDKSIDEVGEIPQMKGTRDALDGLTLKDKSK